MGPRAGLKYGQVLLVPETEQNAFSHPQDPLDREWSRDQTFF